jgi:hypothetical protein
MSKDLTAYQLLSSNFSGPPEVHTMSDEDEMRAYLGPNHPDLDGYGETIVDLENDLKDLGVMER